MNTLVDHSFCIASSCPDSQTVGCSSTPTVSGSYIEGWLHRRSQGPATLGSWPGSHGTAEAGGEREMRTPGSPAGARRTEASAATGERREGKGRCVRRFAGRCAEGGGESRDWREAGGGAADAAAEPGTAPPSLRAGAPLGASWGRRFGASELRGRGKTIVLFSKVFQDFPNLRLNT